jgi:hypothetical protein
MELREPRRGNLPLPYFFVSVDSNGDESVYFQSIASADSGGVRGGVEEESLGDERECRHNFLTTVIYLYC